MNQYIDLKYMVSVDNSSNDGTSLRYARWPSDGSSPIVTETRESVMVLNQTYKQTRDINDAYIQKPLTLLSFAYKDANNKSTVGQKLCCPTNMVGFNCNDVNVTDSSGALWSRGNVGFSFLDKNEYVPFDSYVSFNNTISDTSIFKGLMDYANLVLHDNLIIDALVLPKTVISFDINHIHREGGYNVNIRYLFFQFDPNTLGHLITDASSGFKNFIKGINSDLTTVCFTDSNAQQIFSTNIEHGVLDFYNKRVYSSKEIIKNVVGDPPDITILEPR